jgi:bacterial/archaeal transporter family-2 protein
MSATWMVVAVTVLGGLAAALQAQFAGAMAGRMGTLGSVAVTYAGGGLVIAIIAALDRGGGLSAWREVPPYAFLAGLLGLVIIGALAFGVSRVGVVQALLTFTVSQFVFSALIDHYGWFGAEVHSFDLDRTVGIALLLGGAWFVMR